MADPYYVSALKSGSVWTNDGNGVTLNYKFWTSLPSYYSGSDTEATNFQPFTASMQTAMQEILAQVSTFTNITFQAVAAEGSVQLGFAQAQLDPDAGAWAYYPGGGQKSGDLWTNNLYPSTQDMTKGGYGYFVLMHELGHALGLKHSFSAPNALSGAEDSSTYTVMSYTWPFYTISFMTYDIAALQSLYGANTNYHTGNDTYTLQSGKAYTIWDAGGTDTLDGSAQTSAMTLNLAAGGRSSVGQTENISIAYNVTIENASGGSGNDTIYDNNANNTINGNGGDDTIYLGQGSDTVNGGNGSDTVVFSADFSEFTIENINGTTVSLTHATLGTNIISNVENFSFNDGDYALEDFQSLTSNALLRFSWDGGQYNYTYAQPEMLFLSELDMGYGLSPSLSVDLAGDGRDFIMNILHDSSAPLMTLRIDAGTAGLNAFIDGFHDNLNVFFIGNDGSDNYGIFGIDTDITGRDMLYGNGGNDYLSGGAGNDGLYGGNDNDVLDGGFDNDYISGGTGADAAVWNADSELFIIYRTNANGYIVQDVSDPTLTFGGIGVYGTDTVLNDVEQLIFNDVTINLASLNLVAGGAGWGHTLRQGDFDANIIKGTVATDTILGEGGNDRLYGLLGNDEIYGGSDNDLVDGGEGNDTLYGDEGNDTIYGGNGDDRLHGGLGTDVLLGGAGTDTAVWDTDSTGFIIYKIGSYVYVKDTNDLSANGYGIDRLYSDIETIQFNDITLTIAALGLVSGGPSWGGSSDIFGDANANTLKGTTSADSLYGLGGSDILYGLQGNDSLYGGSGNDLLYGLDGNDTLSGGTGSDLISGGAGTDTAVWNTDIAGFIIYKSGSYIIVKDMNDTSANGYGADRLTSDVEKIQFNDQTLTIASLGLISGGPAWGDSPDIYGDAGANTLKGTISADSMYGLDSRDVLYGLQGNDTLYGGNGNDMLYGNDGNDAIYGGGGKDNMYGGAGSDTFILDVVDGNIDSIADFTLSGPSADTLDIADVLTGYNSLTDMLSDFVRVESTVSTRAFVSVNQDGSGDDWVTIATLNGTGFTGVSASDMEADGRLITV